MISTSPHHSPSHRPGRRGFRALAWVIAIAAAAALAGISSAAQVTLSNLTQTYNGTPRPVTVTTNPTGLDVVVTYSSPAYPATTTPPTNAGIYTVVATIDDPVETGSASGTLRINKANQTITLPALPGKTYGDGPIFATATSNWGLPLTRWQSSDPAVATISQTGEITITGAGTTSIIADFNGNENINAGWRAVPLHVARSEAALPEGTQTVTYDGSPHGLDATALPTGLATQITYRNVDSAAPPATPQVVYQNGPDELELHYASTGLQVNGLSAMAKYANLAGTGRKLHSCDATLVNWARYDNDPNHGYKAWADANPERVVFPTPGVSIPGDSGGYYHPVTLAFYEYDIVSGVESYRLLTSRTVLAFIPWRPLKLADGSDYPFSGYAFRVPFTFPDGVILPDQVWIAVGFNTQSSGTAPLGVRGPYNALNIPQPSGQQAGSTISGQMEFYFRDWRWQGVTRTRGPMYRLRTVPADAATQKPVNAGTYEVRTQAAAFADDGTSISTVVIEKAPLEIQLDGLTRIRDGNPQPVMADTQPEGIAIEATYGEDSSPDAPSDLGSYPVMVTSADPNYEGEAQGILRIGDTFESWQAATFADAGLVPEDTSLTADPDGDGLSNFLEYAANLNPLEGNHLRPSGFDQDGSKLVFTYRRNVHALDLEYLIQQSAGLFDPASWAPATPIHEEIVSDDGDTRVIEAWLPKPATPTHFLRLKVTAPQPP